MHLHEFGRHFSRRRSSSGSHCPAGRQLAALLASWLLVLQFLGAPATCHEQPTANATTRAVRADGKHAASPQAAAADHTQERARAQSGAPTNWRQINNANSRVQQQQQQPASAAPLPLLRPKAAEANQGRARAVADYKLPSWFHFSTFKQLYGKRYAAGREDELHRRIYLRTALKVFEQRALYRSGRLDSLASVDELSDLTSEQLDEFRALRGRAGGRATSSPLQQARTLEAPPECCTYDQVYAKIIEMLSAATDAGDTALSRALVHELQQKPFVESQSRERELELLIESDLASGAQASAAAAAANATTQARADLEHAGSERAAKSTANEPAARANIDDKRWLAPGAEMIERVGGGGGGATHRGDEGAGGDDEPARPRARKQQQRPRELQQSARAQLSAPTSAASAAAAATADDEHARHRKSAAERPWKSNLAPDHQSAGPAPMWRHARPATSTAAPAASERALGPQWAARRQPPIGGSNRSAADWARPTTGAAKAGSTRKPPRAETDEGRHSGGSQARAAAELGGPERAREGDDSTASEAGAQDEQTAALTAAVEETTRAHVAAGLEPNTPLGRALREQLSSYLGQPVDVWLSVDTTRKPARSQQSAQSARLARSRAPSGRPPTQQQPPPTPPLRAGR